MAGTKDEQVTDRRSPSPLTKKKSQNQNHPPSIDINKKMARKRRQEPKEPEKEEEEEEEEDNLNGELPEDDDNDNDNDDDDVSDDLHGKNANDDDFEDDEILSSEDEEEDDADDGNTTASTPPLSVISRVSSIKSDGRYQNKQRLLVLSSRGVTARYRHLLEDLRTLLPHSKKECKLDVGKLCVCVVCVTLCVCAEMSVTHPCSRSIHQHYWFCYFFCFRRVFFSWDTHRKTLCRRRIWSRGKRNCRSARMSYSIIP